MSRNKEQSGSQKENDQKPGPSQKGNDAKLGELPKGNPKPGESPRANDPKSGVSQKVNDQKPGGAQKESNLKPGPTQKGNDPKPGSAQKGNDPKPGVTQKEKDPKPGGSQNENDEKPSGASQKGDDTKPGVSQKDNDAKPGKMQREVSFEEGGEFKMTETARQYLQPRRKKSSPADEDERFFRELFPSFKRSWSSWYRRISSQETIESRRGSVEDIYLQREIGLCSAITFIITVSIGTAIYVAPGVILGSTGGSITESLLVWLGCGLCTLLIAVTYGELVFLVTQSGARFSYLLAAFSPMHEFFGPLPAFLNMFFSDLFLSPAQVSLLSLLLADHIYLPLTTIIKTYANFSISEPVFKKQIIGIFVLVLITFINFRSTKTFMNILLVFGIMKIGICLSVLGGGIYSIVVKDNTNVKDAMFKDMKGNVTGILKAMYRGMWSYEGWSNIVAISEEIREPLWTIPRAVVIGIPIVIFLYVTMNIAFLSVLTPKEIIDARSRYMYRFEEKLFGSKHTLMPLFFSIEALSTAMCIQLGTARTCFAAGREGHLFQFAAYLNVDRLVPTPALLIQTVLSTIYILFIPVVDLIEYCNFLTWTFYGFAFLALIVLRIRMPQTYRLYETPVTLPIILITVSVLVTMDPLFRAEDWTLIVAMGFVLLGIFVYYLFIYKEIRLGCMDSFNNIVQHVLHVHLPTALPDGYTFTVRKRVARTMGIVERLSHSQATAWTAYGSDGRTIRLQDRNDRRTVHFQDRTDGRTVRLQDRTKQVHSSEDRTADTP